MLGRGGRWLQRARGAASGPPPPAPHGAQLSFDGAVFRLKSGWELVRGLLVFQLCALPGLVRRAPTLLSVSRRLLGCRLWGSLLRTSFYGQFVAGQTPPEVGVTVQRLHALGLRPLLAVPIEEDVGQDKEGESWYEGNRGAMLGCVGLSAPGGPQPMMQLKVTALMSAGLCEANFSGLSPTENRHLQASLLRLDGVTQRAVEAGVRVLVDAEYTYVNPALTLVTLALMGRWNRTQPWVWNTYQCYLQDCLVRLRADVALAERRGFCFGVKLVRGAYLEQERRLARERGYPDPLHPTWEATNHSYQRCLDLLLELVARDGQRCQLIVASHNEASVSHAVRRMEELGIAKDGGAVCFGQLLGMCDHVSLALGQAGYATYKSIPYGAVADVLPYLVRRAQENQSVLQGTRKERDLLRRELWRRLLRHP
ncbi:hydroxyproline dehydrogenase isoform X2 [Dermochelys coriacea]|uniref:hydroxyproline dehydrogenase isoform X2 n=1 Tax=Dermochelys coriacea TaxID=27794 RepID=UPI001CA9B559|nr:hydroxyproline dehydrogenase isoform X2 [Dermochelys coriacea]